MADEINGELYCCGIRDVNSASADMHDDVVSLLVGLHAAETNGDGA